MTAQRQQQPQSPKTPGPAWELVRRWPGMRGETKLAWLFLWLKSLCGRQRIDTSAAEIAADQGVTSDAGRMRIKNLAAAGLVIIVRSNRTTGLYTLELPEPIDVARARRIEWNGQNVFDWYNVDEGSNSPTLEEESTATSGAVETLTACVPAGTQSTDARRPPPTHESPSETAPMALRLAGGTRNLAEEPTEEPRPAVEEPPRASRTRAPSEPSGRFISSPSDTSSEPLPLPINSKVSIRSASPPEVPRRGSSVDPKDADPILVEHWVDRIINRVKCPRMRTVLAVKAARNVVVGRISEADLVDLLECLDRKRAELRAKGTPAFAYFDGGLNRLLKEAAERELRRARKPR